MSVDRLLDQLVELAAISAEQADLARAIDVSIAASAAGRLEACGLDGDAMLAAVSQVCGIAVAPAPLLLRAKRVVVKGGDPEVLRRLLAFPAGVDKSGRLQVLLADPESATHLPHLGLPDFRAWLAPERLVRELIAALPESGPDIVTGVDDQMRMLRALTHGVTDLHTGLELGGAPASDQDQFTTESDLKRPSAEAIEAAMAAAGREVAAPVALPRAPSPPPWAPTPATQSPAERPLPRAATPPLPRPAPQPSVRPAAIALPADAFQAAVSDLPPAITFLPPMREVPADAAEAGVPHPAPLAKPAHEPEAPSKKRRPVALLAGGGVVVALGAVVAVILMGRTPAPQEDPAEKKQQQLLVDARAKAAAGDHAWALSSCTDAIAAKPGTSLAVDAALLCAGERVALGERLEAATDLRKLIAALPAGDPRRAKAEELLQKLVGPSL